MCHKLFYTLFDTLITSLACTAFIYFFVFVDFLYLLILLDFFISHINRILLSTAVPQDLVVAEPATRLKCDVR